MLLKGLKIIKSSDDWYHALLKCFLQKLMEELHTYPHNILWGAHAGLALTNLKIFHCSSAVSCLKPKIYLTICIKLSEFFMPSRKAVLMTSVIN